ncbi:MAG: ABC transporter permease [Clostridia bacterium]|nr:ABC transporter permease [Clostridia bacterium]MBN2883430.1 ABC transporter permease [Clostridia bacterium]
MSSIDKSKFKFVTEKEKEFEEFRPSLTYWQDAWRRLKKNKMSMVGLVGIILIILFAIIGPLFTTMSYSDQINDFKNLSPILTIYEVAPETYVTLTADYSLILVDKKGNLIERLEIFELTDSVITSEERTDLTKVLSPAEQKKRNDEAKKTLIKAYTYNDELIYLDYSGAVDKELDYKYVFTYKGVVTNEKFRTVWNKKYPFGSDNLGRDVLTRVMYGARISLTVAFVASLVNFIIGVTYGAIAGYEGGRVDNVMMRIVDIINSVPLVLIIILLMVLIGNQGLWTIILAIGLVYWVGMARLVRGQILALKEQEFVLAATALGVARKNIITRHLIPNAMGPIIISMTMMIPSAVFTEAFMSFIGLGVSAPMASWGTLANNALSGILSSPYQLFFPASAIAITMLAFNFLGDGLRDALDPRLRKG